MRLLAAGRDADVYALHEGTVLRRYRDARRSAAAEAEIMRYARGHGVPVPEVYDVAGPDLVMEHVAGLTMASVVLRRPWRLQHEARRLADVHRVVHAVAAPSSAPRAGDGTQLLHLDLHPDNVILTAGGPCVIDWTNAAAGPAELDVADVWLVLSAASLGGNRLRRAVGHRLAQAFARSFVAATGVDYRTRLAAAVDRRVHDRNISEVELARIHQRVSTL